MTFLRGFADCDPIGECELCRTDAHVAAAAVVVGVKVEVAAVIAGVHVYTGADTRALLAAERHRSDLIAAVVEGRDMMYVFFSRIKV